MTTLLAHFDGHVLVPEEPVDLPEGRLLRVQVEEETTTKVPLTGLAALAEWAEHLPPDSESPGDGAAQLDHYLLSDNSRRGRYPYFIPVQKLA